MDLVTTAAEQVAQWAVGAKVCKAFNQTGFQNMANPKFSSGNAVMFVCGNDSDSKKIVLQLAEQIGFETIDAGELSVARLLEPLAMLSASVQKALPLFQDGSSIILTASIGGSKGFEGLSVYGASKAAIRSFARSWTVDLKHRKIRVNAVSPGGIDTPMVSSRGMGVSEEQFEQFMKAFTNSVPMGRIGNPDEIAKAVAFLASDDSSYITGIELFVDGGIAQI